MKKITREEFLECVRGSQGLISKIQKKLEAATGERWSWETVERYTHKWTEVEDAIKAEKESMLDIAENNIYKDLVNGDVGTSKWYLKMKGKERGYIETSEVQMASADPLNINLQGELFSAEELANCSGVEISGEESTQGE